MKYLSAFYKRRNHVSQLCLLAAVILLMAVCAAISTASAATSETPQYMFVQIADDVKVDAAAKTIRLVNVNQQTLYFSDRPVRIAGHLKMADYLEEWTAKAGKDNFGADPPNAVLSVFEPGQADNTAAASRSPSPKSTVPISSTVTSSSRAASPPEAAQPRCSSIGSGSGAALDVASMASALGSAVPVSGSLLCVTETQRTRRDTIYSFIGRYRYGRSN